MSSPKIALLLVALFILGGIQIPEFDDESIELQESLFEGFSVSNDVWNETPFQTVAVPGGFNLSSAIDTVTLQY